MHVVHLQGNKTCTSLNLKSTGPSQLDTCAYNMYWWLLPEPKYLYGRWHIGAVVGVSDAQRSKMCCTPCSALCRSARIETPLHPISQHQCSPETVYDAKKLKYASYTMGGCSDPAVDIKMDGQDKINHSCKAYRSFFVARTLLPGRFLCPSQRLPRPYSW